MILSKFGILFLKEEKVDFIDNFRVTKLSLYTYTTYDFILLRNYLLSSELGNYMKDPVIDSNNLLKKKRCRGGIYLSKIEGNNAIVRMSVSSRLIRYVGTRIPLDFKYTGVTIENIYEQLSKIIVEGKYLVCTNITACPAVDRPIECSTEYMIGPSLSSFGISCYRLVFPFKA